VTIKVKLITPVAFGQGERFAIREGGHTVGSGVHYENKLTRWRVTSDRSNFHSALGHVIRLGETMARQKIRIQLKGYDLAFSINRQSRSSRRERTGAQ